MLRLEQTIRRIEAIQSSQQLDDYLIESGSNTPYDGCCLQIQNHEKQYLGLIPRRLAAVIKACDLRSMSTAQYKPQWYAKGPCPSRYIFIPQKAQGTDCVAIWLGIEPNLTSELMEKLAWYWQILASYIYDAYRRCQPHLTRQAVLTKRELECLQWVAKGKTSWEIGQILGISERTVNFHISNSIEKTGSVNRQHLATNYMNSY